MPIYEFYCKNCDTIYNFFSRSVNTERTPHCPTCKSTELRREISVFAAISGRKEGDSADTALPSFDEARLEKAMAMLAKEEGKINEDDPRQAAALMRKLSEAAGMSMGRGMEEALNRLERGEDPDQIEQELGDILEGEEPFLDAKGTSRKKSRPKVDETLYEL